VAVRAGAFRFLTLIQVLDGPDTARPHFVHDKRTTSADIREAQVDPPTILILKPKLGFTI
jgi:hypothetical protein